MIGRIGRVKHCTRQVAHMLPVVFGEWTWQIQIVDKTKHTASISYNIVNVTDGLRALRILSTIVIQFTNFRIL